MALGSKEPEQPRLISFRCGFRKRFPTTKKFSRENFSRKSFNFGAGMLLNEGSGCVKVRNYERYNRKGERADDFAGGCLPGRGHSNLGPGGLEIQGRGNSGPEADLCFAAAASKGASSEV